MDKPNFQSQALVSNDADKQKSPSKKQACLKLIASIHYRNTKTDVDLDRMDVDGVLTSKTDDDVRRERETALALKEITLGYGMAELERKEENLARKEKKIAEEKKGYEDQVMKLSLQEEGFQYAFEEYMRAKYYVCQALVKDEVARKRDGFDEGI